MDPIRLLEETEKAAANGLYELHQEVDKASKDVKGLDVVRRRKSFKAPEMRYSNCLTARSCDRRMILLWLELPLPRLASRAL